MNVKGNRGQTRMRISTCLLAMLTLTVAIPVQAAVVFNPGTIGFYSSGLLSVHTLPATAALPESNGIVGIKGWGEAHTTDCVGICGEDLPLQYLEMLMYGFGDAVDVFPADTMPVSWRFETYLDMDGFFPDEPPIIDWEVGFWINGIQMVYGGETYGGLVAGSAMLPVPMGKAMEDWSAYINVFFTYGYRPTIDEDVITTLHLHVPENSLDINPLRTAPVPEPASWTLLGAGLALAGLRRLKKRIEPLE